VFPRRWPWMLNRLLRRTLTYATHATYPTMLR